MINEKKYLAEHPLKIWKSDEVTELLVDFFRANFVKAGLPKELAEELVLKVWKGKNTINPETLRKDCEALFLRAREEAQNQPDESEPLDIIKLDGIENFLDLGANKLATINYYARKYEAVKFIGVDVVPQRNDFARPDQCVYYQIDANANSLPIANQSIDLINIQFVFHHFPDSESIKRNLGMCRDAIKEQGRLVLWEETFTEKFDPSLTTKNIQTLGIKTDQVLTERFYALDEAMRWEFVIANDWLINVSNPHMQWTGQYRTWLEWVALLDEFGFALEEKYNFGLRINGRLKQGVHMLGTFRKA